MSFSLECKQAKSYVCSPASILLSSVMLFYYIYFVLCSEYSSFLLITSLYILIDNFITHFK
jgi:hypothetical protein